MLARQTLEEGPATLAGCAAVFCGYAMYTAYERSAYGELAGGFWIPLMLLLILRDCNSCESVFRRAFDGSAAPLALVLAGAWLSNAPLGVMASYLPAAVGLVTAVQLRSWAPVLRAAAATVLALGLAAFYLVPAAVEQHWVEIRQATEDPGERIENSWLFARHADQALELHDVELLKVSLIAVIMITVALVGLLVSWRRGKLPGTRAWWIPLALIPVVVLLLQFPFSLPVWNLLPKLRFLQFPWRWLVVTEAPVGIFFAAAVWLTRRGPRVAVLAFCTACFVVVAVATSYVFFQSCEMDDSVQGITDAYRHGTGYEGTDEYAPPGADNSLVPVGLPDACLTSDPLLVLGAGADGLTPRFKDTACDATFASGANGGKVLAEHFRISAAMPHAGYLILKLRSYAAWRVTVNGRVADSLPRREDGLMAVPVKQGPVELAVDWTTTSDVIAGRLLSLLALCAVTGLYRTERKLRLHERKPDPMTIETPEGRLS
jgi:hypothetical protein